MVAAAGNTSVLRGLLWMLGLSVLLFWLPGGGGLIAGVVGGYKAGSAASALLAALLPALVFGLALSMLAASLSGMPVLGLVAGMGGFVLAALHVGPMLLGALIGGILS